MQQSQYTSNDPNKKSAFESISEKSKKIGSSTKATIVDSTKKVGSGISQILKDFRAFLDRGNVIDVAVALVMGAAFTAVVNSFVTDLFSPLLGFVFMKSLSFTYMALKCPQGLEDQIANGATLDTLVKNSTGATTLVMCKNRDQIQRFFPTPDTANKAGTI